MEKLISSILLLLLWQCHVILGLPGVVDSPEMRKRAISTKLSSYNSIGSKSDSAEKLTTSFLETIEAPTSINDFEPMKITHEDIITGSNAVYNSHSPFTSGGIIFAIGQGMSSTPLMSATHPQPVLLQYLSSEGVPKQTAVQYVQLLRPLMVVPGNPYLPSRPIPMEIQTEIPPVVTTKPTLAPYDSYSKSFGTLIGAQSAPLTSYIKTHNTRPLITQLEPDIALNMNEYVPAASSRISTSVVAPQATNMAAGFKPSKFSIIAQRA